MKLTPISFTSLGTQRKLLPSTFPCLGVLSKHANSVSFQTEIWLILPKLILGDSGPIEFTSFPVLILPWLPLSWQSPNPRSNFQPCHNSGYICITDSTLPPILYILFLSDFSDFFSSLKYLSQFHPPPPDFTKFYPHCKAWVKYYSSPKIILCFQLYLQNMHLSLLNKAPSPILPPKKENIGGKPLVGARRKQNKAQLNFHYLI